MILPPPPWAIICLAASWVPKNALLRFTAITFSNWSSVVSSTEDRVSMPALFTMTSSRPKFETAASISRCRSSTLETSAWIPTATSPRPAILRSSSSSACSFAT